MYFAEHILSYTMRKCPLVTLTNQAKLVSLRFQLCFTKRSDEVDDCYAKRACDATENVILLELQLKIIIILLISPRRKHMHYSFPRYSS